MDSCNDQHSNGERSEPTPLGRNNAIEEVGYESDSPLSTGSYSPVAPSTEERGF